MKKFFQFLGLWLLCTSSLLSAQKIVLISGSTGGLGLAMVDAFEAQGWSVWAGYHTKPTKDLINRPHVTPIRLDVTDALSIKQAVATLLKTEGHIDALINNAGYGLIGAEECLSIEDSKQLFDVNFFGCVRLIQAVAPSMREQNSGHIINISSTSGVRAVAGLGMYAASKFALEGLSESLAVTLSPWNIHVALVQPGSVDNQWVDHCKTSHTEVCDPLYSRLEKKLTCKLLDLAPLGQPCSEIAELVVQIAQNTRPDLRYQTSEKVKDLVKRKLVDPTGNQMKEEQLRLFQSFIE